MPAPKIEIREQIRHAASPRVFLRESARHTCGSLNVAWQRQAVLSVSVLSPETCRLFQELDHSLLFSILLHRLLEQFSAIESVLASTCLDVISDTLSSSWEKTNLQAPRKANLRRERTRTSSLGVHSVSSCI